MLKTYKKPYSYWLSQHDVSIVVPRLLGFDEARQLEESIAQSRLQSRLEQADPVVFIEIFLEGKWGVLRTGDPPTMVSLSL